MPAVAKKHRQQVTTIRLPACLYEEAKRIVDAEETDESSINEFIVESLRRRVQILREKHLDAQFAAMSHDRRYQHESEKIAEEFALSDWEALNAVNGEKQ